MRRFLGQVLNDIVLSSFASEKTIENLYIQIFDSFCDDLWLGFPHAVHNKCDHPICNGTPPTHTHTQKLVEHEAFKATAGEPPLNATFRAHQRVHLHML